jgi:hypothetical protein
MPRSLRKCVLVYSFSEISQSKGRKAADHLLIASKRVLTSLMIHEMMIDDIILPFRTQATT